MQLWNINATKMWFKKDRANQGNLGYEHKKDISAKMDTIVASIENNCVNEYYWLWYFNKKSWLKIKQRYWWKKLAAATCVSYKLFFYHDRIHIPYQTGECT